MTGTPDQGREEKVEGAILALLIAEHPDPLTIEEVVRELAESPKDFGERDEVESAVRRLVAVGLLHRREGFVWPSRAALRFVRVRS